jgi:hypothetical protein
MLKQCLQQSYNSVTTVLQQCYNSAYNSALTVLKIVVFS